MYNEILRKITSLTLLTILLASSVAMVLPNVQPVHAQVASNPNLFVSAENSQWNNYFSGPQVIQVIVNDPDIKRLDQAYGEPDVTVNGKKLRMFQATDGNWYAYFADSKEAQIADSTAVVAGLSTGRGLDFGKFCGPGDGVAAVGVDFSQTKGFTVAESTAAGGGAVCPDGTANPGATLANVNPAGGTTGGVAASGVAVGTDVPIGRAGTLLNHVVRENKTLNFGEVVGAPQNGKIGQIGTTWATGGASLENGWPIIQLYDFSGFPTTVSVQYNKAGTPQTVNLTFDRIPQNVISMTSDRTAYPSLAQVFITLNDQSLNIDPTEEDSWTWASNAGTPALYYELFTRNGVGDADNTAVAATNLQPTLTNLMFNRNGKFTLNPGAQGVGILNFATNGKQTLVPNAGVGVPVAPGAAATTTIAAGGQPITFIESGGVNTGVFANWDGGKVSNLQTIAGLALRGQSATYSYNDISQSIVGGFAFGNIAITAANNTWASGQKIPITLTDMDANHNSKLIEYLDNDLNATVNLPQMTIGHPFSLSPGDTGVVVVGPRLQSISTAAVNPVAAGGVTSFIMTASGGAFTLGGTQSQGGLAPMADTMSFTAAAGDHRALPQLYTRGGIAATAIGPVGATIVNNAFACPLANNGAPLGRAGIAAGGASCGTATTQALVFGSGAGTLGNLQDALLNVNQTAGVTKAKGFNFFNYDLRSLSDSRNNPRGAEPAITGGEWFLIIDDIGAPFNANLVTGGGAGAGNLVYNALGAPLQGAFFVPIANVTSLEGLINLNGTAGVPAFSQAPQQGANAVTFGQAGSSGVNGLIKQVFRHQRTDGVGLMFMITGAGSGGVFDPVNARPVSADFFSVGIIGDGQTNTQRVNNAIYRWELQETGPNTGVFAGKIEYTMVNQLNIFSAATYDQLRPISIQVKFAAIQDMLQAEARAPQATYLDTGADGVTVLISAQQDVPTHTGVVSFDVKTYKIADTVTITLKDADLNVNNDLIDIYTVVGDYVTPAGAVQAPIGAGGVALDPAEGSVGVNGLPFYSDGTHAIGRLLDIQFGQNNTRWVNHCFFQTAGGVFTQNIALAAALNPTTGTPVGSSTSLANSGFTLVESAPNSGLFSGTFEIPDKICYGGLNPVIAVGDNIKVNYVDFRDDSGKLIEVSDNAGVKGNTGSIKLDKAVYPVPFGSLGTVTTQGDFAFTSQLNIKGVFPLHRDVTNASPAGLNTQNKVLTSGDVIVHIRVNDQDYNISATGTDTIATAVYDNNVNFPTANSGATGPLNPGVNNPGTVVPPAAAANSPPTSQHGPVAIQISRSGQSVLLGFAGGPAIKPGYIVNLNGTTNLPTQSDNGGRGERAIAIAREFGPMTEIAPDAGIFQIDVPIRFTDGPQGADCPAPARWQASDGSTGNTENTRFFPTSVALNNNLGSYCIRQGDVLTVTYNDTSDASGHSQTVTDSSTFDLRNGVLQSDKSVYIIGSDMILTLVEPDLNLDSQQSETIPLDLIEWDSHAYKGTMGPLNNPNAATAAAVVAAFDAKPSTLVETGKDTGIFQSVIKIPKQLGSTLLERGEQIHLEYTDWGPAGSKIVGKDNQDIELTIYTSNFGATVELDQKVYSWTDRVYTTVVAPDHNFDPNLIDTIGDTSLNQVTISTRGHSISPYRLVETGVDTGIFTGYVILTGDNTIKGAGGVDGAGAQPRSITSACAPVCGPTDGFLQAEDSDGVSVSFEFTRDQTVTGSALVRWNIGEVKFLEASYPANGQGVLQIVDPDMNLDPKAVDKFDTNVWSDSDSGGIKLTMTETGEATGIFQGTIYFTTNFQSSGNRLHVAEGDTVTGEYKDRTLPSPYTPADQLRLTATTFIGTIVPPLERAPATNPRIVDSFGNAITGAVKTGQQIQITADLTNGQDRDQPFAYLVQIQDQNGVTVSLSWITGTLTAGQSLNPAQSWTPSASGTYNAQIFVWQSIDNPNALSPPLSTTINVA